MQNDDGDSFYLELEKVAQSLSIGNDRSSTTELKRLFEELRTAGHPMIEAILPPDDKKRA